MSKRKGLDMALELVVKQLREARRSAEEQLNGINAALAALGKKPVQSVKRVLSADARKRIGAAQKARWAKYRKANKAA